MGSSNVKVDKSDYPALQRAADRASIRAQDTYLFWIRTYSILLIFGAGFGVYGIDSKLFAAVAAIVFLAAISVSVLIANKQYEGTWYRARAIAESVKTGTWRFMMRAEPYEDAPSVQVIRAKFRSLLQNILQEHKELAYELGGEVSEGAQVTDQMLRIRALPLYQRKNIYRTERIDDQRAWYAKKSKHNRSRASLWFATMVGLQAFAVLFVLLRIAYPQWQYWPTEVFVVAAASTLTWIQVKRFRELSAAYALTAHEIGIVRGELEEVTTEEDFSRFVGDAENAFSREHTQWVARRD